MSTPKISVCIPAYNGESYLQAALESVLHQSFDDFEVVIVDDCSKDRTVDTAKSFAKKDERIKIYENEKNLGLVGNWNRCIELAKGQWIKFLFQDDLLEKECLQKMWALTPGNEWVVTNRKYIFEEGVTIVEKKEYARIENRLSFTSIFPKRSEFSAKEFSKATIIYLSVNIWGEPTSVLIKKSALEKVGLFDSSFRQSCDYEMWLRLGSHFGVGVCHEKLIQFRVHRNSTTMANHMEKAFYVHFMDYFNLANKLGTHPVFSPFRIHALNYRFIVEVKILTHLLKLRKWQGNRPFEANALENYPFLRPYILDTRKKLLAATLKCLTTEPKYILTSFIMKIRDALKL